VVEHDATPPPRCCCRLLVCDVALALESFRLAQHRHLGDNPDDEEDGDGYQERNCFRHTAPPS